MKTINDNLLTDIGAISESLSERTKAIDYKKEILSESDIVDLKLHLAYARTYADMIRLRLFISQAVGLIGDDAD